VVQTELVTAAQAGDAEAFAALARLSADRLYAIAVRVTRDRHRAEDALQQALIAVWQELPRLRDPGTLRGVDLPPGGAFRGP
jgi:DNA-directed RNA polymerase specialized sigma24 family protein